MIVRRLLHIECVNVTSSVTLASFRITQFWRLSSCRWCTWKLECVNATNQKSHTVVLRFCHESCCFHDNFDESELAYYCVTRHNTDPESWKTQHCMLVGPSGKKMVATWWKVSWPGENFAENLVEIQGLPGSATERCSFVTNAVVRDSFDQSELAYYCVSQAARSIYTWHFWSVKTRLNATYSTYYFCCSTRASTLLTACKRVWRTAVCIKAVDMGLFFCVRYARKNTVTDT